MGKEKDYCALKLTQAIVGRVENAIQRLVVTKTKKELYEEVALKRRILVGPVNSTGDIWKDHQLESQDRAKILVEISK